MLKIEVTNQNAGTQIRYRCKHQNILDIGTFLCFGAQLKHNINTFVLGTTEILLELQFETYKAILRYATIFETIPSITLLYALCGKIHLIDASYDARFKTLQTLCLSTKFPH